jgi:sporulation protein YlmC with PRC-barrel domain
MSNQPEIVKFSDLKNRRIIAQQNVAAIGNLDEILLDSETYKIVGFTCKNTKDNKIYIPWSQIVTIGESILINYDKNQEPTLKPDSAITLIGSEILTDKGDKVSLISDYLISLPTGTITFCLFKSTGWHGVLDGIYQFAVESITNVGPKAVIVTESAVTNPEHYKGGLAKMVGQVVQGAKEKTQQEINHLRESLPPKEVIKEKTDLVVKKAKDQLEDLKDKAQEIAGDLKTKAQEFRDKH